MKFGKRNKYKQIIYSKGVIFILGVLCLLLARSVWERFIIERDMSDRRTQAQEGLELSEERKDLLQERVEYLEGDRGIEEEIRKNFDVAKEGEQVIILTGEESDAQAVQSQEVKKKKSWYQFWR